MPQEGALSQTRRYCYEKESTSCPAAGGCDAAGRPDRLRLKTEPAPVEPAQTETAPEAETATPEEDPAPAEEPEAEDASPAVTLTDMTGREITLDAPAERVVALTASDCRDPLRAGREAICWSAAANTATIRRRSWTFPPSSPATTRTSSRSSRSSRRCCS
ncbi:MAG: hypothetical protein ACLU3I_01860 [Acutalibacteraceae bacterium]